MSKPQPGRTFIVPGEEPWENIRAYVSESTGYVDLAQGDHHLTVTLAQAPVLMQVLQRLMQAEIEP